jgi:RNA polymerase-binding transcription factor DksA
VDGVRDRAERLDLAPQPLMDTTARELLDAERARTLERLDRLRRDFTGVVDASRDSNADDEHDPEGATIAFERSQVDALIRQAELHLEEIGLALERVEDGSYGTCAVCGRPIAPARLEARPVARTCVGCA